MEDDQPTAQKRRKPRGPSRGLRSRPGVVRAIQWDRYARPIGDWETALVNHIGNIGRLKVSILFENWTEVPKGLKDSIWEDVRREFQLEDDKKTWVLKRCNKLWGGFKTKLTEKYITKNPPPNVDMPYVTYKWLGKETWDEFVKMKRSDKAQAASKRAQYIRSFNKYPHYMGQMPYAKKEGLWKEEGLYKPSSSSPSSEVVSDLPDRALLWLLGRSKMDEEGNLYMPNEETRPVAESIKEWKRKEASGEFEPSRSDDALSRALGSKDPGGRVRGFGGQTGYRDVWGPNERNSGKSIANMKAYIDTQMKQSVEDMRKELFQVYGIPLPPRTTELNTSTPPHYSSCHSGGDVDPFASLKGNPKCRLAIMKGSERLIVAYGTIQLDAKSIHNKDMLPEHVHVCVDNIVAEHVADPIPTPSKYVQCLGDAHGGFAQWPKNLVDLCSDNETRIPKDNGSKKRCVDSGPVTNESAIQPKKCFKPDINLPKLTKKCRLMEHVVSGVNASVDILMGNGKGAFCYFEDQNISITEEDVTELLDGSWVSASVMAVYMLALKDQFSDKFDSNGIGFFCPNTISKTMLRANDGNDNAIRYMIHAMEAQSSKRFIFCPYHEENHWVLLVLSIADNRVYSFDSMSRSQKLDITPVLNQTFRVYTQSAQGRKGKLIWSCEQCPQQQGSTECAYFVMRFMFEIMQHHHKRSLSNFFDGRKEAFSEDDVNQVRDIFAEYFVRNYTDV